MIIKTINHSLPKMVCSFHFEQAVRSLFSVLHSGKKYATMNLRHWILLFLFIPIACENSENPSDTDQGGLGEGYSFMTNLNLPHFCSLFLPL